MEVLKKLFASRKFVVSLAGIIFVLLTELAHLQISEDAVMTIVGIIASFVVGQGLADFGKEAEARRGETAKELAEKTKPGN